MSNTLERLLQDYITGLILSVSVYTYNTMISRPFKKKVTRETSLFWKEGKGKLCSPLEYSISNTHVIIDDMLPKKGKRRQHLKLLWFF